MKTIKRTKKEDIKNPEHYFNRYISCEVKNDYKKLQHIRKHECSLDEKLEEGQVLEALIMDPKVGFLDEEYLSTRDLNWLETIEDERLFYALKRLKPQQFKIIYLRFVHGLNHQEIAEALSLSRSTVTLHIQHVLKKIEKYF